MSTKEIKFEYLTDFIRAIKEIPNIEASKDNIGGIHTPAIPQEKQNEYISMVNAVSETCIDLIRFMRDVRRNLSGNDTALCDGLLESALYRFTSCDAYMERDMNELLAIAGAPRSGTISTGSNKVDIGKINPFDAGQNFTIEVNHLYAFYRSVDPVNMKFSWICTELNIDRYIDDPGYLYDKGVIVPRWRSAESVYLLYRTSNPKANGYALICRASDELDGFISQVDELYMEDKNTNNTPAKPGDLDKEKEGEDSV